MAGTETGNAKSGNLEAKPDERDEERREDERTEQQDLNQGMETGTHDTTRHGVEWGPAYQGRLKAKRQKKEEPDASSKK